MKFRISGLKFQMAVFLAVGFFSFAFLGCDKLGFLKPKKQEPKAQTSSVYTVKGTVVAKVNNIPISLEELDESVNLVNASIELKDFPEEVKKNLRIDTREKKLAYLKEELVRRRVFYQAALDRGLDRRDDLLERLERGKVEFLATAMIGDVIKNIDVTSAEIEEAYNANKNLFKEPESRKIREVVVNSQDEANQALIELLQGADFAAVAKNRSIKESAKSGGDLGYLKAGQKSGAISTFDEVAFSPALSKGGVSSVFKGPDGYCIVKIEDIKEGKQVSLSEAFDSIKAIILDRKQRAELDKFYSKLSQDAKLEFYEGEIK